MAKPLDGQRPLADSGRHADPSKRSQRHAGPRRRSIQPELRPVCRSHITCTITDTLGVALSGNNSLAWQPSTQQWVCTIAGQNLTPLAHPTSMAQQWLLIGGDRSLLFYADGQLLFSQVFDKTPVSAVQLFTGANAVGLRNLTCMQDPVVNIAYQDAAGRVRQTHTLLEQDSLVSQTIYNWAGGPVAVTKPAPGSFGGGANVPLCAYRASFVDVASFLTTLATTGLMQGDIADYVARLIAASTERSVATQRATAPIAVPYCDRPRRRAHMWVAAVWNASAQI
jgi:hypothetical protein